MKELGKKKKFLEGICTLLCATVLLSCSLSALTNTTRGSSEINNTVEKHSSQPASTPTSAPSYILYMSENFTDGNMPPISDTGQPWELTQTNPTETWHIDNSIPTYPVSKPSATVNRGATSSFQDEWLITPSLNFSKYTEVILKFWWYTCYYVTVYKRYVEFNVSVSTDGGTSWTRVWSFDDSGQFFHDWTWYEISINNPIVLTQYAGQPDVKIGFQYYSDQTDQSDEQMFSIDDIEVLVNDTGPIFSCNAGGPYEWWWSMQFDYTPAGVRFHGNVTGGGLKLLQWLWDFGDGNTSTIPYYPYHLYSEVGIYNLTLTVKDNTTSPARVAISTTTVNLFLIEPPKIDVVVQKLFSVGIVAVIKNNGEYNASFVNWTMMISWGPLQIFGKTVANGTCDSIASGTSETVRSPLYFFAFGRLHIIVSAYPENIPGIIKHYNGLKIGPLVFVLKESGI
ncbi:MAG TPA: hypothetical protein DSN98_03555 [Thermoplasmata archaeon]|jgi:hypothetical protein|nr:MAG TPA: hypothetical protein DSN98_03555 [Thermoplasmata archaeon]